MVVKSSLSSLMPNENSAFRDYGAAKNCSENTGLVQHDDDESYKSKKKKSSWHQTLAAVAGNVLEWYDFALFGYFSDVISGVFFPANQPGHMALIESFVVFGGAFLMRPVGGMTMGYIGDIYGTKVALILSIFLMALPTFLMGCLPGYETLGPWAIVMLVAIRLLQGISAGGQFMSSMVYTLENHPHHQWGFYASLVMATGCMGTMLGGIAGFGIRAMFTEDQVHRYGWRIPFLMGFVVCISGFYLRSHSYESEEEQKPSAKDNPIRIAFAPENCRKLVGAIMVVMLWSGGYYLTYIWMAVYMADLIETPIPGSYAVASVASFVGCSFVFCYAGHISDRYGRKFVMTVGGISIGISAPVLIQTIRYSNGNSWISVAALTTQGIFLALWGAPMCSWLVENFDETARLTSVAVGYNMAHATAGGFSPSLATILVDAYGPDSPGYIITAFSAISLIGLWVVAPTPSIQQ